MADLLPYLAVGCVLGGLLALRLWQKRRHIIRMRQLNAKASELRAALDQESQ